MSRFTLYRADVESPRLARVITKVPGVAVAGEEDEPVRATDDETAAPTSPDKSEDDGGLREKIPVPDTDVVDAEKTSVVKSYGLLGLGVSMVMLGIATVGIWLYRRRAGDGGESETPPPVGMDAGGAPAATAPSAAGSEPSATEMESSMPAPSTARPAESSDDETEPRGRAEGDRTDVEWTTKDTTPAGPSAGESDEPTTGVAELDADEGDSDTGEDEPRPTESVDAAPLLGAAFLALSGAVVKWLQTDADEA